MYKFLTAGLLAMTSILFVGGIFFPDHITMWLSSTSVTISVVRLLLIIALIIMLFSEPPRGRNVRLFFGTVAGILAGVVVVSVFQGSTNLLDILVFAQMAIILRLEALEYQPRLSPRYKSNTHAHA